MLACALRFLAGGSYHDITFGFEISRCARLQVAGRLARARMLSGALRCARVPLLTNTVVAIYVRAPISLRRSGFYRAVDEVVDAINSEYTIGFDPSVENGLASVAADWRARKGSYINGIVGAVDGIAIKIRCPSGDVENPGSYYNRKGFYALIVQAVCDARRRFISVHAKSEGSTPDSVAWNMSSLGTYMHTTGLASGYCIVGDAAYALSDCLLTPYPGNNLPPLKDTFNYFQSHYRIEIGCSFGMLNRRWRIFWRPLEMRVGKATRIITCCMKLHNICHIDASDADFPVDELDKTGTPRAVDPLDPQDECDLEELSLAHRTGRRYEKSYLRDFGFARTAAPGVKE